MTAINQKEYLKKYLGIGRAPGEKKKKKKKAIGDRLKIIDDDADVLLSQEIQEDLAANEDAPQIVAVVDERPPSLRIDEQTKSNLWKPIGEVNNATNEAKTVKLKTSFKLSKQIKSSNGNIQSSSKLTYRVQKRAVDNGRIEIKKEIESSPIRSRDNDVSPPRIRRNSDYSPPRRSIKIEEDQSRKGSGDDSSPPRKHKKDNYDLKKYIDSDSSPPRRNNKEKDYSSMRKKDKRDSLSPPRNKNNSPPRRKYKDDSSSSSSRYGSNYSPPRKRQHDQSPPRKKNRDRSSPKIITRDTSPTSRRKSDGSTERRNGSDYSPPRRINKEKDYSPPRKRNKEDYASPRMRNADDISPPRRRNRDDSPPRSKSKEKTSRWGNWSPEASPKRPGTSNKMKVTLDGKKAGLQNAKDLVKETTLLKRREDEIFQNMSAEVSGRNAATVVRAKKVQDPEEVARQLEKEKKTKEKYDRWGKGVKQVEEQSEKIANQLHEMSKPLARYADDEDLERYLKEQEREGDPMLAYIRKKKKKQAVATGVPEKPMYMGEFMPNRFGIRPGYRWDGVDRSNGYEKRWFEVQNAKKATQEDAFKWSTEDM